jgi:transmembrane sensor
VGLRGGLPASGAADGVPHVTPQIAAEAAMWVARLHGPNRTREMELQCLHWQGLSAAHRHAFERCTETWMEVPNAARAAGFTGDISSRDAPEERWGGARKRTNRGLLAVATLAAAAVVTGAVLWRSLDDAADYRTAVGEAQTVVLEDGSRLSLNTNTRVHVDFSAAQRTVNIGAGEAAFEVAQDVRRPFVVRAGGSEVVALGTVFSVRLVPPGQGSGASLAVTLVEGKVAVRAVADADAGAVAPERPLVMNAGERVRLVARTGGGAAALQQLDRPRLEQVLAWQRNEAVFDGTTLAEAVAEMNRYSRVPVVLVGDLAQADWQVSGQFRTGDNLAFARALAMLHGLVVREHEGRLELHRSP